ncbi:MAG TPA: hypothetical protein VEF04_05660, partial [Blastocatellia bacterium]|nr:hypothetical protein [Blastocatellia bacterium]
LENKFKMMELEKRISEIEYRTKSPNPEEIRELFTVMKEFGVQRLSLGMLTVEMPYNHFGQASLPLGLGSQVTT